MRTRTIPGVASRLLKLFCSSPEHESMIGDLMEQYQRGRGRVWYWRQVVAIVALELHRKLRRRLISIKSIPLGQASGLVLFIAALSAVLVSDLWPLFLIGILAGVVAGILKSLRGDGRTDRAAESDAPRHHPGISIHHIPVEGAAGLLFVLAVVLIFGAGVRAVREILLVTIPLGILGAGILAFWHRRHAVKIHALDLHNSRK